MRPPVFITCTTDATVALLIGTRLYPFGTAPEGAAYPYAVYQAIHGRPELLLSDSPEIDDIHIQIDCYADTGAECEQVAEALRGAIEPVAHVTGFREWPQDKETKRFRFTLEVDWFVSR